MSDRDPLPDWLKLDTAAKIFPAVSGIRQTSVFRLSATLTNLIDPVRLQESVDRVLPAFPVFQTRLRPGFFWFTLEHETRPVRVIPDGPWPCMPLNRASRGYHLLRVRWYRERIALEVHHSLTDGTGAMTFLNALVGVYLGQPVPRPEDLGTPQEQAEDAFQKLHNPQLPRFREADRAYQLPFRLLTPGQYHVTTGRLDLAPVLALAKAQGLTLTEFLAAHLLLAIQQVFRDLPATRRRARPLRLTLPVNLRKIFPSKTLRNYFAVVPVEIDLRLGEYTWSEVCHTIHHQLQAQMDPKLLQKQVMRNLRGEEHPIGRFLPLALKNVVLGSVSGQFDSRESTNLSNLGRAPSWGHLDDQIKYVDFVPPPSTTNKVKVGVISHGNVLSITFGNLTPNFAVERAFFRRLRQADLVATMESNRLFLKED